ncbi:MAG: class I SAM-dependent methyltransferase [archaeon]
MESKKAEIKARYELSAEVYDSRYCKIQNEKFSALDGLDIRDKIIDLGCGTGLLADFLKPRQLFGCDISFEMLKKAKERGMIVVQADLDTLPFKKETFNSVVSFTVLQNLPAPHKALAEIKRISKFSSVIVLTYLKKFDFSKEIKKEFDILEIRDLGEDEGYICLGSDK